MSPNLLHNAPPDVQKQWEQRIKRPEYHKDAYVLMFVYGTLKHAHHNNRIISESEYHGSVTTTADWYDLLSIGGNFPGLLRTNHSKFRIKGELYRINGTTLASIDVLEDEGNTYTREGVNVVGLNGTQKAQTYFIMQDALGWLTYDCDDPRIRLVDNIKEWC